MNMRWSLDQQLALSSIDEFLHNTKREFVLNGPAGTGKTSILIEVVGKCKGLNKPWSLMGPTGKSSLVLSNKTGTAAATIHRRMYGGAYRDGNGNLRFSQPGPIVEPEGLAIIDEASMVSSKLYKDIMVHLPDTSKVMFIGDKAQLSPVNDTWGPDLDAADASLTTIHRQAEGSMILELATTIRNNHAFHSWKPDECELRRDSPVDWYLNHKEDDTVVLVTMNATRNSINDGIRFRLDRNDIVNEGDKIVNLKNHRGTGIVNGDVFTIDSLEEYEDHWLPDAYSVFFQELPGVEFVLALKYKGDKQTDRHYKETKKAKENILLWDYGYALTVHKSQGSQFRNVGFVQDSWYTKLRNSLAQEDQDLARRLGYTAVTRASHYLSVFK